jgi:hypothetical protein
MLSWAHRHGLYCNSDSAISSHTSTTTDANTSTKPYGLIVLYGAQTPDLCKFFAVSVGFEVVRTRYHHISRIVFVDFHAKYDGCIYHSGMSWANSISPSRWASSNIKSSVVISPRRVNPIPRYTACASSRPMRSLPSRDSGISCGAPDNMLLPRQDRRYSRTL